MRELNLDWLRTLVTIADRGSFAAAARSLHLAPPTVSLHIAELEARLGAALLVRQRGQVVSREAVLLAWQAQPGEPGAASGPLASNALEVYVHRLRRKLAGSAFGIRNIRGLGYMLDAADA